MHSKTKLIIIAVLLLIVGIACGILITVLQQKNSVTHTSSDKDRSKSPSKFDSSWPMFRGGPALLGIASGELPEEFKFRWKFKTDDAVRSSAVIDRGRVFIGSDDGNVYAIDLANGKKIWSFQTQGAVEATPCLFNQSVLVGSSDSFLYALDAETGDLKWKYKTGGKILGSVNYAHLEEQSASSALILVGSYDNKLHCVDFVTGNVVWTYETDSYINGAAAVADGKAIFGGCDGIIHIVSVVDGEEITAIEAEAYIAASVASTDKHAFVGNYAGQFFCTALVSGEICWSYENEDFPFFSSPAVNEDRVIFGSRDKRLHCVDRDSGKPIWTFQTRDKVDSSPVICGEKVVVGSDDGRLYVVSLSDGEELWAYEIGEAITSSPAVAFKNQNGMIVVGAEDGYVYAFDRK